MILLWGHPSDGTLASVLRALTGMGARPVLLDQRGFAGWTLSLEVGAEIAGFIHAGGVRTDLAKVTALFARPYDFRGLPAARSLLNDGEALRRAAEVDEGLSAWSDVAVGIVINRPAAMASNNSKPYQSRIIAPWFEVPEWLLTTDPEAVRSFQRRHRSIVYKSISGVRSVVSLLDEARAAELDAIIHCPTQFQRFIEGRDVRVHVVGDEVFACAIESDAIDYRYDSRAAMRILELGDELAGRCRGLARALGLPVAGIDLRRTAQGEWFCFEVNPSPAFSYYESSTGLPIAKAVAQLLAGRSGQREAAG